MYIDIDIDMYTVNILFTRFTFLLRFFFTFIKKVYIRVIMKFQPLTQNAKRKPPKTTKNDGHNVIKLDLNTSLR